ncbi:MAG: hypothetical protein ACD_11C00028G0015 [uncultured bacterium]|nr:MAG: hypothetical protein ACD_11C00028G0015 [uncultured bacterium]HBR71611.1 hypothetical protein [Candidatus Moranbacteria bacterium]
MKKIVILAVMVLNMIFFAGFSFAETNWEENALEMPDGIDLEAMVMEALIKGVNVANTTENSSAQEVMNFLMKHHQVASPKHNEVFSTNIFAEGPRG